MKPTRRDVMTGISALAVSAGCRDKLEVSGAGDSGPDTADAGAPERAPEPEPWVPDAALDEDAFPLGVQAGDPVPDGVVVSVWTSEPVLAMMLAEGVDGGWDSPDPAPTLDVERLVPEDGHTQLVLSGLKPDTVYSLCFSSEDLSRRSRVTRFRTALSEDDWRVVTFALTSCLGKPGRPWPSMTYAAAADPDAFLLLGDAIYASSAYSTEDFLAYYRYALSLEGLAAASAHSAIVAVWDDHEVTNNFGGATTDPTLLSNALDAFRMALPQRTGGGALGLWRKLSWGSVVDVFVLDCRGERDGADGYISEAQMAWLKAELESSTARFKLIMNSVPITDYSPMLGEALAEDRWQGFPEQRAEILQHIEDVGVEGLLWLTGDFHMGVLSRVDPPGGLAAERWELMAGSAGSTKNVLASLYDDPEQFPIMFEDWNSVLLRLDPGTGEAEVSFLGDDGSVLATRVLGL